MSKFLSFGCNRLPLFVPGRFPKTVMYGTQSAYEGESHSKIYQDFRPQPPNDLIEKTLNFVKVKLNRPFESAVDIGCGSGQATKLLVPHFNKIIGFDCSKSQIEEAIKNNIEKNVEFRVSDAEHLPIKNATIDLVIACEAVHWFNIPKFFEEVNRILVPSGVVAIAGYTYPEPWFQNEEISQELQKLVVKLFTKFEYLWPPTHSLLFNHYKDICIPYKEVERIEPIPYVIKGSLQDLIGHLTSRSGFQELKKRDPHKLERAMKQFENEFKKITNSKAENDKLLIEIVFNYFLILTRKPNFSALMF